MREALRRRLEGNSVRKTASISTKCRTKYWGDIQGHLSNDEGHFPTEFP
jgi:hypothetical protein